MKKIILSVVAFAMALNISAQVEFSAGADLVSSYVWRGGYGSGASFQPSLGFSAGAFSLGAWGSTDIYGGGYKEVDFTAGLNFGGFVVAVTDYWWSGEGAFKYLDYGKTTEHLFEATVGYTFSEKFPLTLKANTMFAGADKKSDDADKQNFSTYLEASYGFNVKDIALEAGLGFTPAEGLYASEAAVTSISLKATKEIKISDSFSLPVFSQLILNPHTEGIFLVFGLSL
ncbi:MAG: hypothetical protein LBR64_05975 [Dysgonamonadaceae bacterium]|nr:hypothetical protein [Dysgonamonadaceae bacterium]